MKQFCKFCQAQLSLLTESVLERTIILECLPCKTVFGFHPTTYQLKYYQLCCRLNERNYKLCFNLESQMAELHVLSGQMGMITLFDYLPNITPTTFPKKLPILLLFS